MVLLPFVEAVLIVGILEYWQRACDTSDQLLPAEVSVSGLHLSHACSARHNTMRAELIGDFQPCITEIYLHIDARMADYIRPHP